VQRLLYPYKTTREGKKERRFASYKELMVVTNAKSKGTLQETADMQMVNLNKYI
jgi:hypothetical protein